MSGDKKKIILQVNLHDGKEKQKALKEVSKLHGIDSISMDMKDKKLTVVGDVDPVSIAYRLRKFWKAEISKVESAKEPEKKKDDEPKKEGNKKEKDGPTTTSYTPYIIIPPYVEVTEDYYPQCCVIC